MQYQDFSATGSFPYPNHNLPASSKGRDWCMQYAKAAYYDWQYGFPKAVFSANGGDYEKFRMYALGKQPVSLYKKLMGVDSQTNQTWLAVDWSIRSIVSGYRDKVISRLMKEDYGVVATPIDMLAQSELNDYINEMKAKLAVRDLMIKQNPELAQHPLLGLQPGDPTDIEELEMRLQMNEQFTRSQDAEKAIALGFYQNDYKNWRRKIYEDLFDLGVAGYFEWLGEDNKARFRAVNPDNVIINYCRDANFKDLVHAGEIVDVSLIDLALINNEDGTPMFDDKTLTEFAGSIAGKYGNPSTVGSGARWMKPYDKFKCRVLQMYFYTYNEETFTDRKDSLNNPVFRIEESGRGDKNNPRYKRKRIQYVYKCSWIIGTDKCYDWGMCYDQKRTNDLTSKAKTSLPYKFVAYNFYEMRAQGFMERLVPYIDEYQLTTLKIQNFKNRAVPSGWWIDLSALESTAMKKGGKDMTPMELLQMFFETGVLVGRSVREGGEPQSPNWKPVIPIENTAASELAMFYQDLIQTITTIEKMTGYNDITSGNPNPKTLVPGYQMAEVSTQDALYPLAWAEETLSLRLAEDVLCRMQQGVKKGGVSGYAPALNSNTLFFMTISPEIAFRDYGIELEKRTTDDQKAWLLQQMQMDIQNGWLDTSDAVILVNTKNAKQAQMIWSYRVKKAKEKANDQELQKIQLNNQGAKEAAQIAQQSEMYKFQLELKHKERLKFMELQASLQETEMKINNERLIANQNNLTKLQVSDDAASSKVIAQHVSSEGDKVKTAISGEAALEKQRIANEKPTATKK